MGLSSTRKHGGSDLAPLSGSFQAVVWPEQGMVKVAPTFLKRYFDEIKKQEIWPIENRKGLVVLVEFGKSKRANFMCSGAKIARVFGYKEPTVVRVDYDGMNKKFKVFVLGSYAGSSTKYSYVKDEVIEVSSDSEGKDDYYDDGDEEDEVWVDDEDDDELKDTHFESRAIASRRKCQVMHFPNHISKKTIPNNQERVVLKDMQTRKMYSCHLITSSRSENEKYLGEGWYKFVRDRKLKAGQRLIFDLERPPKVMTVLVIDQVVHN